MVRVMVYALVVFFWVVSLRAEPISPGMVLYRVEQFYRQIESLSGSFSQEVYWRKKLQVDTSGGKFWFRKPYLLRWEYQYPEKLLIVCDGKKVYYYAEADHQVLIFKPEKVFSKLLLGLLTGKIDPLASFRLLSGTQEGADFYFLELEPQKNIFFSRVKLKVHIPNGEIKEIWSWDVLGNITHVILEDLKINSQIKAQKFIFKIPRGVEVIRQRDSL